MEAPSVGQDRPYESLERDVSVVFVDIETTGLDPERHGPWEIALVFPDNTHRVWYVEPDLATADPNALRLTGFYERYVAQRWSYSDPRSVAKAVAESTAGVHLVGACVSFDALRLEKFLRANGQCPAWHYHLVDVEALAAGKLGMAPPWNSDDFSERLGLPKGQHTHAALDDARWAKSIYDAVLGL